VGKVRLLVVEDEPQLGEQLVSALSDAGYAVDRAEDGERGRTLAEINPYDAVVLDLGLPRVDGLTVLRSLRDAGMRVPVVILTARGSWHEKVEGIDAGADDYLAKPFRMEELLARIRALIRRASGGAAAVELRSGPIALDTRSGRVTRDGAAVSLTAHELRVLAYLLHHRDRVVSRAELSEHIYAEDLDRDSNTIEVFVARLRRKLGSDFVKTVRGLGYRVEGDR
jgi:two-component system, OmpR family, response regulator